MYYILIYFCLFYLLLRSQILPFSHCSKLMPVLHFFPTVRCLLHSESSTTSSCTLCCVSRAQHLFCMQKLYALKCVFHYVVNTLVLPHLYKPAPRDLWCNSGEQWNCFSGLSVEVFTSLQHKYACHSLRFLFIINFERSTSSNTYKKQ